MLTQAESQQMIMVLGQAQSDTQDSHRSIDEMWQILGRYDAIQEDPTTRMPKLHVAVIQTTAALSVIHGAQTHRMQRTV